MKSIHVKKAKTIVGTQSRKGFTLVEILIVLALVGFLAALTITNLDKILDGGKDKIARNFVMSSLEVPLTQYKIDMGNYPSTSEMSGFKALLMAPSQKENRWNGPYIKPNSNLDPWGNEYKYKYPGEKNSGHYDLWSTGPDGIESKDDIGNWN